MVYENRSAIERLGELTEKPLSLELKILGIRGYMLKPRSFFKVNDPKNIIIYSDGVEIKQPSKGKDIEGGIYGQLYVQPLRLVAVYFIPTERNKE